MFLYILLFCISALFLLKKLTISREKILVYEIVCCAAVVWTGLEPLKPELQNYRPVLSHMVKALSRVFPKKDILKTVNYFTVKVWQIS